MNNEKAKTIMIYSSNGCLEVDAETGMITDNVAFSGAPPMRFDVAELASRFGNQYAKRCTSFDILNVGSWDEAEKYCPPCSDWQADTKANVVSDLAAELDITLAADEIPDAVFWQSTLEELRERALENVKPNDPLRPRFGATDQNS